MAKIYATGRRKASIAKVWLTPGTGNITINNLSLDAWLGGLVKKAWQFGFGVAHAL